ncbi:phytanoyl-CoA dioxygenase family protein [Acidicapsa dinghuensis]|uniref:Phytanoyl-CoA dioxygenase family protein n=1 Tax=Acidicapsa dinghuensis TaxID=2218256 RepID=A0ABW1ELM1_9BACT|nr:phytanoyl-CoA dioxygenase family protein [Acidicapsa dinghuensis]
MLASMSVAEQISQSGFAIYSEVTSEEYVTDLIAALSHINETDSVRRRGGIFAIRNLLDVSSDVCELAHSNNIRNLVEPVLGDKFFPVRGILFDKIPDANWKVPWHQDLTIAVQQRIETEGFGPWSIKSDVLHVQPPACILEKILTVRIHLDKCHADNGALRVIAGSHNKGRIAENEIAAVRELGREAVCEVDRGGVLLMRPLLLHASSPSSSPSHRRVIHIDYASIPLPNGLKWLSNNEV